MPRPLARPLPYPDRRVRALAEMRYLLVMGQPPTRAQVDALKDPLLITALTGETSLDAERFDQRWALADTSPSAPWAENLRVRLLAWAARHAAPGALPKAFPEQLLKGPLSGKLSAAARSRRSATTMPKQRLPCRRMPIRRASRLSSTCCAASTQRRRVRS
jgi:hypothetical protein